MRRALPSIAALLALGCGPEPGLSVVADLDATFYVEHVHSVVRFGCSSLACHGVEGRPLRIYAEDGLRLRADLRDQPIDPEEVAWNVAAFGGIDPDPTQADQSLVLLKPLAVEVGGTDHSELEIWPARDDLAYVCLLGWLSGSDLQPDVCDAAAAALDPYPPEP